MTLEQLQKRCLEQLQLKVSTSNLDRVLKEWGLSYKKTLIAREQNRDDVKDQRRQWRKLQKQWDRSQLIFIDECGINTKMVRLYGRSASSQRCVDYAPYGYWHTNTFIAALRHDRIDAPILFDGPMNASTFLSYIQEILIPTLKPGDLVICDNLSSHKSPSVRESLQAVGADFKYLPSYSPDMNPIEMAFSKIKAFLRSNYSHALPQIIENLAKALDSFSESICSNLFKHANYVSI